MVEDESDISERSDRMPRRWYLPSANEKVIAQPRSPTALSRDAPRHDSATADRPRHAPDAGCPRVGRRPFRL